MDRQKLAEEIRTLRNQRSWSQTLLAEHAGLSLRTVQRLEKEGVCSQETLLAIASVFEVDVTRLTRLFTQESLVLTDEYEYESNWIEFSLPGALSKMVNKLTNVNKRFYKNLATWGLLLLVIPLTFIIVGVFKYSLGFESMFNPFDMLKSVPFLYNLITSPAFLLGSLATAIGLNVLPLIDLRVKSDEDQLTGSFSIMGNRWNAIIVGASLFFMTSMMSYALIENVSGRIAPQNIQVPLEENNMTKYELINSMVIGLSGYPKAFSNSSGSMSTIIESHNYAIDRLQGITTIPSTWLQISREDQVDALNDDKRVYEMLGFYENLMVGNNTIQLVEAGLLNFDEQGIKETYLELRSRLAEAIREQEDFLATYEETDLRNLTMEELESAIEDLKFLRAQKEMNQVDLAFLVQQSELQRQALEAYINTVDN